MTLLMRPDPIDQNAQVLDILLAAVGERRPDRAGRFSNDDCAGLNDADSVASDAIANGDVREKEFVEQRRRSTEPGERQDLGSIRRQG